MPGQVREHWTLRTGLTGDCKPFWSGCWEPNASPLWEQWVLWLLAQLFSPILPCPKERLFTGQERLLMFENHLCPFTWCICVCVCMFLGVGGYATIYLWCQNNLQKSVPFLLWGSPGLNSGCPQTWLLSHRASSSHACDDSYWFCWGPGSVSSGWLPTPQWL